MNRRSPLPAAANWRGSKMEQRMNPWRDALLIFLGLLWMGADAPCLYADHDTSLRTDLNFSYTFDEKYRAVSYVFIQADDEMSNYDYAEWGGGLHSIRRRSPGSHVWFSTSRDTPRMTAVTGSWSKDPAST